MARADRDQQGSSQTGRAGDSGASANGRADRDQQGSSITGRAKDTGSNIARNARGAFDVTAKSPSSTKLPPNVTPAVPAGQLVGDYSPYYHWNDWDRVRQAAMLSADIAGGGIFGFVGDLVRTELPGKMTPPRGYTKTGVRTGATRSADANDLLPNGPGKGLTSAAYDAKANSFAATLFANMVPSAIDTDQYFAFFNPGN